MDAKEPNPAMYNVPWSTEQFNGMPYRRLGSSGLRVSCVGLGTWKIGYPHTGDGSRVDAKTAFLLFDRALERGVTFWDTANRYNNASGNSERVIGHWLRRNSEQRRNIILATKLFGGMDGVTPNHSGLSRANILDSVEASLDRLQTGYIDLLFFHAFDEFTPIEESLSAVEDLVRDGRIRYFAVSNFTREQLAAYRQAAAGMSIRCRVLAVENRFDLLDGEAESRKGVLPYAAEAGLSFIPWSPLAGGWLTGRYLDPSKAGPGDRLFDEGVLQHGMKPDTARKLRRLAQLSEQWGLEMSQLVIAYMLTLPGMGPVIPSASSVSQLESNASAARIVLSKEQLHEVREALLHA